MGKMETGEAVLRSSGKGVDMGLDGKTVIDTAKACAEMAKVADMVCVVRCKNCKYWEHKHGSFGRCSYEYWDEDGRFRTYIERFCDDYCSDGERKE